MKITFKREHIRLRKRLYDKVHEAALGSGPQEFVTLEDAKTYFDLTTVNGHSRAGMRDVIIGTVEHEGRRWTIHARYLNSEFYSWLEARP